LPVDAGCAREPCTGGGDTGGDTGGALLVVVGALLVVVVGALLLVVVGALLLLLLPLPDELIRGLPL